MWGKEKGPWYIECQKGEEMDSASCTMHGDFVFPGIDTTKAERWYAIVVKKLHHR